MFDALFDRATIAYLRKDDPTAHRLLTECLEIRPDDPRANELMGKVTARGDAR